MPKTPQKQSHKIQTISKYMIVGLMTGSALVTNIQSAAAYAEKVTANSKWSVSRVASISQGNYCTMAQQFGNGSVMSFAQNEQGEYSIALDFQKPIFDEGKPQKITLTPGNGKKETFQFTPSSRQAAVVGIGKQDLFLKSIEASQTIKVEMGSITLEYDIVDFKSARNQMAVCVSNLNKPDTKTLEPKTATKETVQNNSPSIEGLLAAKPKPSLGAEPLSSLETSAPVMKVDAEKVEQVAAQSVPQTIIKPDPEQERRIQGLLTENAQLKRALSQSRQDFERQLSQAQGATVSEIKEKLAATETENETLKQTLSKLEKVNKQSAKDGSDNASLENELSQAKAEQARLAQETKSLHVENESLREQISAANKAQTISQNKDNQEQILSLQTENSSLKKEIEALKIKTAENNEIDAKAEIETLKSRLSTISSENQTLKNQVSQLASAKDLNAEAEDENSLRKEIRTLKIEADALRAENADLKNTVEKIQKEGEASQLKTVGGSWDLEQATRRYQESQREIRRLGALLESERVKCVSDKKEIEMMLFDPKIASNEQIARLNELEDKVKEREQKIAELKEGVSSPSAQKQSLQDSAQVTTLKEKLAKVELNLNNIVREKKETDLELAQLKQSMSVRADASSTQIADLKEKEIEIEQLKQRLKENVDATSQQNNDLNARNIEVAQLKQNISNLESRLAIANKTSQKEMSLAANQKSQEALAMILKEELMQKSKELGDANAKLIVLQGQIDNMSTAKDSQQFNYQSTQAKLQSRITQLEAQLTELQQSNKALVRDASYSSASNYAPAKIQEQKGANGLPSIQDVSNLLSMAGVVLSDDVKEVGNNNAGGYKAYSWKSSGLYGSAEMRKANGASDFDKIESQYLARAKSRCDGDFAAIPSQTKASGAMKSSAYEIACVGAKGTSSASVLFTYSDGLIETISHEGQAETMDSAMDIRDKIAHVFNAN